MCLWEWRDMTLYNVPVGRPGTVLTSHTQTRTHTQCPLYHLVSSASVYCGRVIPLEYRSRSAKANNNRPNASLMFVQGTWNSFVCLWLCVHVELVCVCMCFNSARFWLSHLWMASHHPDVTDRTSHLDPLHTSSITENTGGHSHTHGHTRTIPGLAFRSKNLVWIPLEH